METEARVYCGGSCDQAGCRGHDVLQFRGPHRLVADDPDDLLEALFAEVERLRELPVIGPCKCAEPRVVDGLIPACAVCAQPLRMLRVAVEPNEAKT